MTDVDYSMVDCMIPSQDYQSLQGYRDAFPFEVDTTSPARIKSSSIYEASLSTPSQSQDRILIEESSAAHSSSDATYSAIIMTTTSTTTLEDAQAQENIQQLWSVASSLLARPPSALSFAVHSRLAKHGERKKRKRWDAIRWSRITHRLDSEDKDGKSLESCLNPSSISHGIVDYVEYQSHRRGDRRTPSLIRVPPKHDSVPFSAVIAGIRELEHSSSNSSTRTSGKVKKEKSLRRVWWIFLLSICGTLASAALIVLGCLLHNSSTRLVFS